jgi:hypothetical protein
MGHRNIFGPVLALEVPLEVALVVEGVVAMRTLVELLLMSCNVPFEQRLARPLFRALRAFKEGFFFDLRLALGATSTAFFSASTTGSSTASSTAPTFW